MNNHDVLLISMPFSYHLMPSIGLALLKSSLTEINVKSKILYFSLKFARNCISPGLNYHITEGYPFAMSLMGDWIFSHTIFESEKVNDYVEYVLGGKLEPYKYLFVPEENRREIFKARDMARNFIDSCLEEVLAHNPKIVGFSSNYAQHVSSLSLAKKIKERNPEICVIFGGTNCEGLMGVETLRQFPFIDAVVSGDGDVVFPEIVKDILSGNGIRDDITGVYTEKNINNLKYEYPNTELVLNMDTLPYPDHDDFFEEWGKNSFKDYLDSRGDYSQSVTSFETSRGCWWGQKHRCTFCGYGQTIGFRCKSPERSIEEFDSLLKKYDCPVIHVGNILDMNYFQDFIAKIKCNKLVIHHVKVNLKKEQIKLISDNVHKHLQPGIENLNTRVLKLMHKGATVLQILQFLKWCREMDVNVCWNLLWGFPGELAEDYKDMAELIPLISHLQPPNVYNRIYLSRFSPYFNSPEKYGITGIEPYPAYNYVYPELSQEALFNMAYFFTFKYEIPQDVEDYTKPVVEKVKEWMTVYPYSSLSYMEHQGHVIIHDGRPVAKEHIYTLSHMESIIYMACDGIKTWRELKEIVEEKFGQSCDDMEIKEALRILIDKLLMLEEDNKYLSLAVNKDLLSVKSEK